MTTHDTDLIRRRQYRRPRTPIIIPPHVAERAATRYEVDESGCWISTYSVASHGYAQIGWQERPMTRSAMTLAHRAAWVHRNGRQVPDGMTVDHLCKRPRCVRPDHLRLLSNFENARRTSGRDWTQGECVNGHSNEHLRLSGKRWICAICKLEYQRRYRARKRKGQI